MTRSGMDVGAGRPDRAALLSAAGAELRTRRGPVFTGLTVEVLPASVVAIVGESGRGRTSALMALAGLMDVTDGRLVRTTRNVAVARLDGIAELEARLSVDECVGERLLLARVEPRTGRRALRAATDLLEIPFPDRTRVEDLAPAHRTLLSVALALMSAPDVVVLDDLDAGVGPETQAVLWNRMHDVAGTGPAVVATAVDAAPAVAVAVVDVIVRLERPDRGRRGSA